MGIATIFEGLKKQPSPIPHYFRRGLELWREIMEEIASNNLADLSEIIRHKQCEFERECGSNSLGKHIMAVTAFAQFYPIQMDGLDENTRCKKALLVFNAIKKSACAVEVKTTALKAARIYHVPMEPPIKYV